MLIKTHKNKQYKLTLFNDWDDLIIMAIKIIKCSNILNF
jgi:hypothetical protein